MPDIRGLYVIVDPAACTQRGPADVARQALEGGAGVIQWRDKLREKGDQLSDAHAVREFCLLFDVPFIANDHLDLGLALSADGVHLGQHDLPPELVRPLVPEGFIIGVSTNNAKEAIRAVENGATYVAIGAVFPTGSKEPERTREASVDAVREVAEAVNPSTSSGRRVPVVAIGGINASNIDQVIAAGADAVAVISAVCVADDPRAAAAELAGRFPS